MGGFFYLSKIRIILRNLLAGEICVYREGKMAAKNIKSRIPHMIEPINAISSELI